jgi:hypothetical protein
LDYVLAFLPDEALELVAFDVTSSITRKRSRDQVKMTSSHRPFNKMDILLWIAERLDIALNIKIDIKVAYNDVCFSSGIDFLFPSEKMKIYDFSCRKAWIQAAGSLCIDFFR